MGVALPTRPQYGGRIRNAWQGGSAGNLGSLITSPGAPSGQMSGAVVWAGAASFNAAFVLSTGCGALIGGSYAIPTLTYLNTRKPAVRFREPIVMHSWEALLHWPVPLVAKDSGIYFGVTGNKVVGGAEGVGVYNDNGTVRFISRGPAGTESVALAAVTPAAEWNKFRLDMVHATSQLDARFDVYLNDTLVLSRTYAAGHKLPVPTVGSPAFSAYIGQDDAATPMYVRGWHYFESGSTDEGAPQ